LTEKKLVIVSASSRRKREPSEPIPAIERYDGIYFRILRKYFKERKLRNIDVLILSEKLGLMSSDRKISYNKPHAGKWGQLSLNKDAIENSKRENLEKLKRIANNYSKIYVNIGHDYMKLIKGFEKFTTSKITYAKGKGLGPKASHMKNWLISQQT